MRRQILTLLLGLLMTAGTVAAGYPEGYYGPPIPDGCMEVEAYVPAGWYLDRNPWSSPSPEEGIFWFGTLCVEGPVAVLEFTKIAGRHCHEVPWGTRDDEPVCYAWHWVDISHPDRHVMVWEIDSPPDWGFYLTQIFRGDWEWFYESLTNNDDGSFTFIEGVFGYVTPFWYVESDNYTRWKFLVSPRHTKSFGLLRGGMRIGK